MCNEIDHVVVDDIPEATSSVVLVRTRMIPLHSITTFGTLTTTGRRGYFRHGYAVSVGKRQTSRALPNHQYRTHADFDRSEGLQKHLIYLV